MNGDNGETGRSELERRTKALFDQAVAGTDGATRSRLNRARQRALAELERPASERFARWLPLSGAAAVVLLALLLVRVPEPADGLDNALATDLEILLDAEELELLEDLEFYAWLDEQAELDELDNEGNGVG